MMAPMALVYCHWSRSLQLCCAFVAKERITREGRVGGKEEVEVIAVGRILNM